MAFIIFSAWGQFLSQDIEYIAEKKKTELEKSKWYIYQVCFTTGRHDAFTHRYLGRKSKCFKEEYDGSKRWAVRK